MAKRFKYKSIVVGGTFDHIHKGHRALLDRAFETATRVLIGVTSDQFVKESGKVIHHSFQERVEKLEAFLSDKYPSRDYLITKLEKTYGPGVYTKQVEAIVVSTETLPKVEEANKTRRKMGLPDLKTEIVQMVMAKDESRISSTRIRRGEIDSEGNLL
ncbi:MAG: phosphopantetheine adenylyltransferase [Nitrososphaerales archaeon]